MKKIYEMRTLLLMIAFSILVPQFIFAEEIANRLGITIRTGIFVPADSRFTSDYIGNLPNRIETDSATAFNGGLIYGCDGPNDDLAIELEVSYAKFDATYLAVKTAEVKSYDVSLGVQYRFITRHGAIFSPYMGIGADLLINDLKLEPIVSAAPIGDAHINTTWGGHLKLGADFFVTKKVAVNIEAKGVWGVITEGEDSAITFARYNPSSLSGLVGMRYFFN